MPSDAPDLRVDETLLPPLPDRRRRRAPQPVRLPGPVELLRRPASARLDRAGARARLGRAARRRRLRAHEPARPLPVAPGLRRPLLLQDVRLADRCRRAASPAARRSPSSSGPGSPAARSSPPSCSASGTSPRPGAAHFEDGTVNFLNLPAVEIGLRHIERIGDRGDPRATSQALDAALLEVLGVAPPHRRRAGRHDLRAARRRAPRRHDRLQLPPRGRAHRRRALRRPRRAREHGISLRTGCFCNPGAGEVAFTI